MKQLIITLITLSLLLAACGGEKPVTGICYADIYEQYSYTVQGGSTRFHKWDSDEQRWITEFGIKGNPVGGGPDTLGTGFYMETEDERETMMRINALPFDTLSHTDVTYMYDGRVAPRNGVLPVYQKTGTTVIRFYYPCVFLAPR